MSSTLNEELIRSITSKAGLPLVFRGFVKHWPLCQWNVEKWCSIFGDKEIPFRCLNKNTVSDEPCWERRCSEKKMTFQAFTDNLYESEEWMYFDYKYLHQWFSGDIEFCKNLSWKDFGFHDKGAADTTLWVGSNGAHTPAHQDTYGVNIVAQLYGKSKVHTEKNIHNVKWFEIQMCETERIAPSPISERNQEINVVVVKSNFSKIQNQ